MTEANQNQSPSGQAAPSPSSDPEQGVKSLTLYELTGVYAEISRALDEDWENDPEREKALATALDTIKDDIIDRGEYVARIIKQKQAEVDYLENVASQFAKEAERIRGMAGTKERASDRLTMFLKQSLAVLGDDTQRTSGTLLRVTLTKSMGEGIEIVDEAAIPVDFFISTIKMPTVEVPTDLLPYVKRKEVSKAALNDTFQKTGVAPTGTKIVPKARGLRLR